MSAKGLFLAGAAAALAFAAAPASAASAALAARATTARARPRPTRCASRSTTRSRAPLAVRPRRAHRARQRGDRRRPGARGARAGAAADHRHAHLRPQVRLAVPEPERRHALRARSSSTARSRPCTTGPPSSRRRRSCGRPAASAPGSRRPATSAARRGPQRDESLADLALPCARPTSKRRTRTRSRRSPRTRSPRPARTSTGDAARASRVRAPSTTCCRRRWTPPTQEPDAVAARNAAEQALLQLRRLLDLPLDRPLVLLDAAGVRGRPACRCWPRTRRRLDAALALRRRGHGARAARGAARRDGPGAGPSLIASATVSHQAYPTDWLPEAPRLRRRRGRLAQAAVAALPGLPHVWHGAARRAPSCARPRPSATARARASRSRSSSARQEVQRALATLAARRGTAALAQRAHHLATVRWTNGLSTQLEVSDARLQMQTAEVNEVAAVKDYRLALLRLERARAGRWSLDDPINRRADDPIFDRGSALMHTILSLDAPDRRAGGAGRASPAAAARPTARASRQSGAPADTALLAAADVATRRPSRPLGGRARLGHAHAGLAGARHRAARRRASRTSSCARASASRKGQVLARFRLGSVEADAASARAQLQAAPPPTGSARRTCFAEGAVSERDVETAEAAYPRGAGAGRRGLAPLSDATVRAPGAGRGRPRARCRAATA